MLLYVNRGGMSVLSMVKVDQDGVVAAISSTGVVASKILGIQPCTDVSHVAACAGTEEKNW
eukprot:12848099-Ditylum_brightwellii.AAC.1